MSSYRNIIILTPPKQSKMTTNFHSLKPKQIYYYKSPTLRVATQGSDSKRSQSGSKIKVLLTKNKSLKNFFQAHDAYLNQKCSKDYEESCKKRQESQKISNKKIIVTKEISSKRQLNDEYFAKSKKFWNQTKSPRQNLKIKFTNYEKIHAKEDQRVPASLRGSQLSNEFYDPKAYDWRKSKSKQKHLNNPLKENNLKQPKLLQSEYYNHSNTTKAQNSGKQSENIQNTKIQRLKRENKKRRSASHSFNKKPIATRLKIQKQPLIIKSVKMTESTEEKKQLLFTFGF